MKYLENGDLDLEDEPTPPGQVDIIHSRYVIPIYARLLEGKDWQDCSAIYPITREIAAWIFINPPPAYVQVWEEVESKHENEKEVLYAIIRDQKLTIEGYEHEEVN